MKQHGQAITLLWVEGTPDGIITAQLPNWNGKAIELPRESVSPSEREELKGPGVYFLFRHDHETGEDSVCIGSAECLQDSLDKNLCDYEAGLEKHLWQTVVAITGENLNNTMTSYLANRMVQIARESKRCIVLSDNSDSAAALKEHERVSMEGFIDNAKVVLAALNHRILEPIAQQKASAKQSDCLQARLFFLDTRKAHGTGRLQGKRFVILPGSRLRAEATKTCPVKTLNFRNKLIKQAKKVVDYKTTEDIEFSSSSAAAAFLTGFSTSGPEYWKTEDRVSLKEFKAKS